MMPIGLVVPLLWPPWLLFLLRKVQLFHHSLAPFRLHESLGQQPDQDLQDQVQVRLCSWKIFVLPGKP
jgi:hypothetical protein